MNTTVSLYISRSFLIVAVVSCFSCTKNSINGPDDNATHDNTPAETYSLSGKTMFPDGTPIDSAYVWETFHHNPSTYADSTGHYQFKGLSKGLISFIAQKGNLGTSSNEWVNIQGNQHYDFILGRRKIDPVQSEYGYRLVLHRYPLADMHAGTSAYYAKFRFVFSA